MEDHPKKAILTYFGDSAIITDHGGTMTLIFHTPTFDDNLASTAKERFATADTLEHFTLRLSRRPRATLVILASTLLLPPLGVAWDSHSSPLHKQL